VSETATRSCQHSSFATLIFAPLDLKIKPGYLMCAKFGEPSFNSFRLIVRTECIQTL